MVSCHLHVSELLPNTTWHTGAACAGQQGGPDTFAQLAPVGGAASTTCPVLPGTLPRPKRTRL
jgi:hypothetical protein